MTQEELDALMNGDVNFDEDAESNNKSETESHIESEEGLMLEDVKVSDYKPDP
ncbi:TPA: chemotaxis protein, partial [Campylobacter coli]|nr:chemotaxis protein [Campylobacter coli]